MSKKSDEFGDRIKQYEQVYTSARIEPPDVLCARIDGKGFSKFTKGFRKPFDDGLSSAMVLTTMALVEATNASVGYTQSDEITLIWSVKDAEYMFGGKVSKLNSVLASMATAHFNAYIQSTSPREITKLAYFDCRAFAVPSVSEAANVLLWRVQDARKNSVSSLFRWTAGHKAMDGLDQMQMKEYLLKNHNTDWNDLPNKYKYGTYVKPLVHETYLSEEERIKIPENKRPEPGTIFKRRKIELVNLGYFGDLSPTAREEFVK